MTSNNSHDVIVTKADVNRNGLDNNGGVHSNVTIKNMDRLTLPREQKTVDAGKCLPAGDSLPSWSTLAMDAKFPMVQTPKGTLSFHTTKYCTPKYRRKSSSDFDLTDPNGMSMSSEYHPLHDPHLKAHFNVPWMRSHLVRNGFITDSGMVICNLKEFNKYRQYLRRICLMELMRERKRENQKHLHSSSCMPYRPTEDIPTMSARFVEARRRQIEKIEKQRLKQAMMAKLKGEQMERKKQEQMGKQAESMKKRQEEEDRRREALIRNAEEMEIRNLSLLRKWRRRDRQHSMRIEDMRRQRVLDLQKRNKESWENRKRVQRDRMDRETEARERVREEKERWIGERERYLMRQRDGQMRKLNQLKSSSRHARAERERICTARLAARIAAIARREERRYRGNKSLFRSEWTLQQVLRRLSFGDLTKESSHQFMQMLGAALDQAVDRVTAQSEEYDASESNEDREMRRFAADLVESVVTKVRDEIYPAYLRLLQTGGEEDKEDHYSDMYEQEFEQSDNGTDDELVFSNRTSDEHAFTDNQRSVRFSFDESIIPASMDSLEVLGPAGLKPVSEHMLTPVPSPIPGDGSCSEFDFRVPGPSKPTKRESRLTESLLLRLLDDLNHGRLKREDLLKLTGYCIDVVKVKEARDKQARDEARSSPSGQLADQLVNFTISKIMNDVKSGSLSQDDLTSLTQSIVKDAQNDTDVTEEDLDRFVSSALSSALDYQDDDDEQNMSDWMLEDFVSRTLSQVKDGMEQKKFTEEELKEMAAAVVASVLEDVAQNESLFDEESMKQTLHKVLDDAEADKLVGAVMDKVVTAIVSSYHTLTSKDQKSSSEMVEEFVTEVLSNVIEGIKAGEYSELELKQMVSAKEQADVNRKVQNLIDSLLNQIEGGRMSESEMSEIGSVLVDTGRKLLAARGVSFSTDANVDPEAMTSTELADKVVREVIENIQGEMEDQAFEKEALKALAASFLKVKSSSMEGLSNVPTVGSSRSPSYFSTLKPVSPTESSLATDVVLAAMDRIARDLQERNIPVHMLSSIACSLAPASDLTPSIFISDEGFSTIQSAFLPQHVRMTLIDITQLLKGNRVCYDDAKRIFGIILQTYLCRDTSGRSFTQLSEDDSLMIETLISETINNVIRNVTSDISCVRVATGDSKTGMSLSKLSGVMSENDLEKFVWDTLHRIGQDASMESVLSRPHAPVHFPSHSSVDSLNVESLVRETLTQVARDICEGISSDSSLLDARRDLGSSFLSAGQLSSKIVGLVNSVLEELVVGLESGRVSRVSIAQFMEDICPGRDFKAMEAETLHRQLLKVMDDVIVKKTASVYFNAIADKFSNIQRKSKQAQDVMTPELQAIGNILSAIDANVLTQFVQATLVAILGGVQTQGSMMDQVRPGSITSLVKVESSVIARQVVGDVIHRIENDFAQGTFDFNDMVRKDSSLASCYVDQLIGELKNDVAEGKLKPGEKRKPQKKTQTSTQATPATPPQTRQPSKVEVDSTTSSMSGKFSAYVMQTLKSVVSDLGTMSESGLFSGTESLSRESSTLLDDYIHKQLKHAVDSFPKLHTSKDDQDTEAPKTSTPKDGNTPPVTREPSGFMTEVMHEVVDEMLMEKVPQSARSQEKENESTSVKAKSIETVPVDSASSSEVAKLVLASLKHALSADVFSSSSLLAKDSISETKPVSELSAKKSEVLSKKSESEVLSKNSGSEVKSKSSVVNVEVTSEAPVPPETSKDPPQELQDESGTCPETAETSDSEGQTNMNLLVAEVLNQTILSIKDGKLSNANLTSLVKSLSRKDVKGDEQEGQLVEVLESVKGDILGGVVKTDNMEHAAREIAIVSMDKDTDKKPPSKTKVDSDSNTSVQSMVKDVLSHIVVSLSEGNQADKTPDTDDASDSNTNKNISLGDESVSPGVISNLANKSIRNDSPAALEAEGPKLRNSFRSLVNPDDRDVVVEPTNSADLMGKFSDTSNVSDIIVNTNPNTASTKSVTEDKKKVSTCKSSDVSISSGDSGKSEKIIRETLPKDTVSLKSSSSDQRQKAPRKPKTSESAINRKTGSKSKDGIKKTTAEGSSKSSVPAIHVDSCSSVSNTSSRVRMSSSNCTSSSSGSKQDARSKKTAKKQTVKNVPDKVKDTDDDKAKDTDTEKVKDTGDDVKSAGSEASQTSQVDVMQIRSVCGSHTTQIRVRESQSDSSKE